MKLGVPLLSRRAAAFSVSWLLREPTVVQRTSTRPDRGFAVAAEVPGLSALTEYLRAEVRRSSRESVQTSLLTSGSRATSSASRHPRSRVEATIPGADTGSLKALWDAASPWYYRVTTPSNSNTTQTVETSATTAAGDAIIVPCDWRAAVRAVAATLPYEGVLEATFARQLVEQCPGLSAATAAELASMLGFSGVPSLAGWVHAHFPEAILVTRSAATGEPLYHNRENNSIFPPTTAPGVTRPLRERGLQAETRLREVTALQQALQLLGRDKQLPLWTDFSELAPLLPTGVCPRAGEWCTFLAQPHIRAVFDVEANLSIRYAGKPRNVHVFVDRTSISASEADTWLAQLLLSRPTESGGDGARADDDPPDPAAPDIKVLVRPGDSTAMGSLTGTLRGAEVVTVERLLDPEHVMAALLNTILPGASQQCSSADFKAPTVDEETEEEHSADSTDCADDDGAVMAALTQQTVHVLCSDSTANAVARTLRETCKEVRRREDLAVYVHTPTKKGALITDELPGTEPMYRPPFPQAATGV